MEESSRISRRVVDKIDGPQLFDPGVRVVVDVVGVRAAETRTIEVDCSIFVLLPLGPVGRHEFLLGLRVALEDDRRAERGRILLGQAHHVAAQVAVGRAVRRLEKMLVGEHLVAADPRVFRAGDPLCPARRWTCPGG